MPPVASKVPAPVLNTESTILELKLKEMYEIMINGQALMLNIYQNKTITQK